MPDAVMSLDAVRPRAPKKGAGPASRRRQAKENGLWPRFQRFRSRLALIVGSAGFSAIMIGIVLNATVMQKEHHPAPLFTGSPAPAPREVPHPQPAVTTAAQPLPTAPAAAVPVAPAVAAVPPAAGAPSLPDQTQSLPATVAAPAAARPVAAKPHKPVAAGTAYHADGIGQFLTGSGKPAGKPAVAAPAKAATKAPGASAPALAAAHPAHPRPALKPAMSSGATIAAQTH